MKYVSNFGGGLNTKQDDTQLPFQNYYSEKRLRSGGKFRDMNIKRIKGTGTCARPIAWSMKRGGEWDCSGPTLGEWLADFAGPRDK